MIFLSMCKWFSPLISIFPSNRGCSTTKMWIRDRVRYEHRWSRVRFMIIIQVLQIKQLLYQQNIFVIFRRFGNERPRWITILYVIIRNVF